MTWAKYGHEFWDECAMAGLSDAATRTHAEAIGWLYRLEDTSCRIPKHLVRRFAGSPDYERAAADLVAAGFWADLGEAWEVRHHREVIRQSIAAQRRKRDQDAARQRRHRQKKASDVTADVTRDITPDVAATQTVRQSRTANHGEAQVSHANGSRAAGVPAARRAR